MGGTSRLKFPGLKSLYLKVISEPILQDGTYAPLNVKTKEIRILVFDPNHNTGDDIISATLTHKKLAPIEFELEMIEYGARSYVSGSLENPKTILLNNKPINVTSNLVKAFLHLVRLSYRRNLSIDALCINQNDLVEGDFQHLRSFSCWKHIWIL